MSQIQLNTQETLIRESITARINQAANAICQADVGNATSTMKTNPLEIYTAIVAQEVCSGIDEETVTSRIHLGGLIAAREMKYEHIINKQQEIINELKRQAGELVQASTPEEAEAAYEAIESISEVIEHDQANDNN